MPGYDAMKIGVEEVDTGLIITPVESENWQTYEQWLIGEDLLKPVIPPSYILSA